MICTETTFPTWDPGKLPAVLCGQGALPSGTVQETSSLGLGDFTLYPSFSLMPLLEPTLQSVDTPPPVSLH